MSPDNINNLNPNTINGLNLYSYCRNSPVMYIDSTGRYPVPIMSTYRNLGNLIPKKFKLVSNLNQVHITQQLIKDPFVSRFFGNFIITNTISYGDPGLFYSYQSIGNDGIENGMGINLGNWLGGSIYSTAGYDWRDSNVGFNLQITPWVNVGASVGWSGIGFNIGFNSGNTTTTYGITVGWGTIGLTAAALIIAPELVPIVALLGLIFGF